MSLVIEVLEGKNTPIMRNQKIKGEDRKFFHIPVAVEMGKLYPVEVRWSVESETHFISPGKYTLSESSFKVNQYGDLELDRYNMALIPLRQEHKKAS